MIKILFFGDIMGKIGRRGLSAVLPDLKKQHTPDLILANAENLSHGNGATEKTIREMRAAGIDAFTSGNHIWDKKKEILGLLASQEIPILRPLNYPPGAEGRGDIVLTTPNKKKILLLNAMGRVFFKETLDCPFRGIDAILKSYEKEKLDGVVVDFHAEATSEKVAFGLYLDGRVSAVVGTHSHIITADNRVLSKGTAYITDLGMVGAKDSVIGVSTQGPLQQFLTQQPQKFEIEEDGACTVTGVLIQIDEYSRMAKSIERVFMETVVP